MQQRLQALFDMAPPHIRSQLGINSGARSYEHQQRLWNDAVAAITVALKLRVGG